MDCVHVVQGGVISLGVLSRHTVMQHVNCAKTVFNQPKKQMYYLVNSLSNEFAENVQHNDAYAYHITAAGYTTSASLIDGQKVRLM